MRPEKNAEVFTKVVMRMAILQSSKSRRYDQTLLNCRFVSTSRQQKKQTTIREANGVLSKVFSCSTAIKLKNGMKSVAFCECNKQQCEGLELHLS